MTHGVNYASGSVVVGGKYSRTYTVTTPSGFLAMLKNWNVTRERQLELEKFADECETGCIVITEKEVYYGRA